jgi:hypothetical protein
MGEEQCNVSEKTQQENKMKIDEVRRRRAAAAKHNSLLMMRESV